MYFFGYTNIDKDSYTNFYEFQNHTDEHLKLHNGFKQVNEESLKEVLDPNHPVKLYMHNKNKDMVDLAPPEFMARAQEPGMLFAKQCLEEGREGNQPASLGIKR